MKGSSIAMRIAMEVLVSRLNKLKLDNVLASEMIISSLWCWDLRYAGQSQNVLSYCEMAFKVTAIIMLRHRMIFFIRPSPVSLVLLLSI